ncbi:putative WD repeat-containing protein C3H5.08c [Curvularia clavata]|uniref:WD repeat-containing protein C3H5.08c n=1 Tax=Curvularia clavata TaxID=95742 RepID=A0A9Q8ZHE6_CURCL|nr:putative WD repeat-containing protein C3H5.08c [Curvularia clavata]
MADAVPKIVTTPAGRGTTLQKQDNGSSTAIDVPLSNKKLVAKLRSPTTTSTQSNNDAQQNGGSMGDAMGLSETPIDPLSQQILQRTNTSPAIQKLRSQNTDPVAIQASRESNETAVDKISGETARGAGGGKADKKKVSFLSRFIGSNKKKTTLDSTSDNGSEAGDLRHEGTNAQLYINNLSFSPRIPHPPAYIKVRAKFKKEKEFDRVFLAQELRTGSDKKRPPAAGSNTAPQSGSAATQNPIWAVEFSKDGRYLAAGGQDRVIRVWAVIDSPERRRAHENTERDPHAHHEEARHLSAPVFQQKPIREYKGHTSTILDLSWSKNNFLLSSSMDKTVRLWHVSRDENLCTFKHSDFVPSIQFHPTDDRFFLAGSLDAKLRLWSIPDKSVAYLTTVSDMITSVAFTPDGKTCMAGTLGGLCLFYDTEGLKWQAQLHVKSTRGQNAKGSKITGIHATYWPPGSKDGEIKLLVSSNDSRLRIYNMKDKALEMKFRGHQNNCSQIRATFADSTGHIVCGSEDRKTYIWSTTMSEGGDKRDQRPMEMFEAHNSITTCAIIAPTQTRQLLSASEDPIFDLCNPPPVTLVSKAESVISSRAATETESAHPTPAATETNFKKAAESPAYIARSAHHGGNIIVTADYTGALKVFRQDCAFQKRVRQSEQWDTVSAKRTSGIGRPSSIISRTSRSRRDSVSTQPPHDRIMTWRQGISHGSIDSGNSASLRSASPRKSLAALSLNSTTQSRSHSPILRPTKTNDSQDNKHTDTPGRSSSIGRSASIYSTAHSESSVSPPPRKPSESNNDAHDDDTSAQRDIDFLQPPDPIRNPLAVYNGQSWLFWTSGAKKPMGGGADNRPDLLGRTSTLSQISQLTDERSEQSFEERRGG